MAKKKSKIVVFRLVDGEYRTLKGERLQDYTNSESLLSLAMSPYRVFFRLYDETFSWEMRKGHYDLRLIISLL